jgi:hypothetical protein
VVIRGHQRQSEVIRGNQWSSEVIRGHQRFIRGHQRSSEAIRGRQRTSPLKDTSGREAPRKLGDKWQSKFGSWWL